MANKPSTLKVAIVGGGLVGALSACFFAKRGHEVHLYEYREDIRVKFSQGRSIDLALSDRGRAALRVVGLEDIFINEHGIPMWGRMTHARDGTTKVIPYDPVHNKCIYSISRNYMNEVLLSAAEEYPNVHLHFNKKLIDADVDSGRMKFFDTKTDVTEDAEADFIIGADGAHSTLRTIMINDKKHQYNFNQTYIEHGYVEFSIPAKDGDKFALDHKNLHIWPRGEFMMIALPNKDFSFTVNLFAPYNTLSRLNSPEAVVEFYKEQFPDVIQFLTDETFTKDFFVTKPRPLVSIKCEPYHIGKTAVIMGDAAHAMVPFYAQGMNAGLEDVLILDQLMERYNSDLSKVLPAYSEARCSDGQAICDLAMYNYIEMRDLVRTKSFLVRKYLDSVLYWLLPNTWVPLYYSVHFSRMCYHKCITNREWQDKVLKRGYWSFGAASLATIYAILNGQIVSTN